MDWPWWFLGLIWRIGFIRVDTDGEDKRSLILLVTLSVSEMCKKKECKKAITHILNEQFIVFCTITWPLLLRLEALQVIRMLQLH